MVMPRPSSSGLRSIRRELQRRKHKPLAPKPPPAAKKPFAPRSHASPCLSSAVSAPLAAPSSSGSSSMGSACASTPNNAAHMKPGTRVLVRTRSLMVIDGKTIVFWLAATVVSAADSGYEVIYEGNLPRDNPFATVHVPLHHFRPIKPSPPTPPFVAAGSCASAATTQAAVPKNSSVQPAARPTTAGKSLRLIRDLAPEMKPAPRPTTAGKSIRLVRRLMSEMEDQTLNACLGY